MAEDSKKSSSRGIADSSKMSTAFEDKSSVCASSTTSLAAGARKHNLVETTFRTFTDCLVCRLWNENNPGVKKREEFIWGIVKQGFKCTDCGFVVHRKCRDEAMRTTVCSGLAMPKILKFLSSEAKTFLSHSIGVVSSSPSSSYHSITATTTPTAILEEKGSNLLPVGRSRSRAALAVRPVNLSISCLNLPKDLLFVSMFTVRVVAEYEDNLSSPSVFETEIIAGNNNPIFATTMNVLRQDNAKLSFQVREKSKLIGVINNKPLSDILTAAGKIWKYQLNSPQTGYRMHQGTLVVKWEEATKESKQDDPLPLPAPEALPSFSSPPPAISVYSNCVDGLSEQSIETTSSNSGSESSMYTIMDEAYQNVYGTFSDISLPSAAERQKRSHLVSQLFDVVTRLSDVNFETVWGKYGVKLEEILEFSRDLTNSQPETTTDLWNQKFQECAKEKDNEEEIVQSKFIFHKLSQDFVQTACMYGKVIITEMKKPYAEKTCKPATLGGTAGGTKYIVDGILFKLAEDPDVSGSYLYGGVRPDLELANKAAGHEIKGAIAYSGVPLLEDGHDVKIPTQVLVDYWGYRLVAMPLLPIGKGKAKLVWGSSDAGATVHDDDENVRKWMKHSALHLHLKPHKVADKIMYSAGDVEGHVTNTGQSYLLDLARSMPPEYPLSHLQKSQSCVFWRLQRPEFLQVLKKKQHAALSPDALSGWGRIEHETHDLEIKSASRVLCETIRDYAKELNLSGIESERALEELCVNMHRKGINIRHLALLRNLLDKDNKITHTLCLIEMVKRSLKNILRALLREEINGQKSVSDHSIKAKVSFFLNEISQSLKTSSLWNILLPQTLVNRFGNLSLSQDEHQHLFHLCEPFLSYMIGYILKRTGLALSPYCVTSMRDGVSGFVFTDVDLMDAQPYLKRMPSFDLAAACELVEQASKCNPVNFQRLILSAKRSAMAAASAPTVAGAHIELANLLNIRAMEASPDPPLLMVRSLWQQSPQLIQHRPDSATGVLVWGATTAAGFLVSQGYGEVLGQYLAGPAVDVRPFAAEFQSTHFMDLAHLLQANSKNLRRVYIHGSEPLEMDKFAEHMTSVVLASHCLLDLGGVMISALLRHTTRLTMLDLSNCMIGDRTAAALGEWLESFPPLQTLLLDNNSIGPSGATSLAAALPNNHTLTCLSMRANLLSVKGGANLAKALERNTTMLRVNINENLVPPGIKESIRSICSTNMQTWALSQLSSSSSPSPSSSSSSSFSGELDLSRGCIPEAFILRLISQEFPSLTSLNLTANKLTDKMIISLAEKLETNTTLQVLDLRVNRIGSSGIEALIRALRVNTTLSRLDLRDNSLGREAQVMLSQSQVNNNLFDSASSSPSSSTIPSAHVDPVASFTAPVITSSVTVHRPPPPPPAQTLVPTSKESNITLCYAPTFEALMEYQRTHLLVQQSIPIYFTALLSVIRDRGLQRPDLLPKLSSALTPKIHEFRCQVESHDLTTTHLEPTVAVGSLKFWLRGMGEPLIPMRFYSECVQIGLAEPYVAMELFENFWPSLPELNRHILSELIILARQLDFFKADNGLDIPRLAEVFAPNLYRAPAEVAQLNAQNDLAFLTFVIRTMKHPQFGELVVPKITQTRVLW